MLPGGRLAGRGGATGNVGAGDWHQRRKADGQCESMWAKEGRLGGKAQCRIV